ncbi:hypothetical protein L226DRAFT_323086 [Lentinus tigrinus ALCF2SS1-7]|uniref:uncharacterized protein n=1 Tax=Lentinus tigrinus ALCF2SS1-7 TaxID=1328758 RepID=UPI001165DF5C|nr:hypothetical protein L226DRAFT_323086 [Lentinus tigrinus ALCF2SS1-7]
MPLVCLSVRHSHQHKHVFSFQKHPGISREYFCPSTSHGRGQGVFPAARATARRRRIWPSYKVTKLASRQGSPGLLLWPRRVQIQIVAKRDAPLPVRAWPALRWRGRGRRSLCSSDRTVLIRPWPVQSGPKPKPCKPRGPGALTGNTCPPCFPELASFLPLRLNPLSLSAHLLPMTQAPHVRSRYHTRLPPAPPHSLPPCASSL